MKLYIRYVDDDPHRYSDSRAGFAQCGVPLAGARAITEKQALVWLGNRRCAGCFPSHVAHEGQLNRHG